MSTQFKKFGYQAISSYEMSQENGAKSDVHWLSLTNNNGVGMQVSAQTHNAIGKMIKIGWM
jgi:hypothetical protein